MILWIEAENFKKLAYSMDVALIFNFLKCSKYKQWVLEIVLLSGLFENELTLSLDGCAGFILRSAPFI